jgi:hypothetical protein
VIAHRGTSRTTGATSDQAEALKSWDVLRALQIIAEDWPKVIHPRHALGEPCPGKPTCRPFSKTAAFAVVMSLHSHYNWKTFEVAMPVAYRAARPAHNTDIATEVGMNRRTAGVILSWLDQDVTEILRGHGWTGATVRRFNVHTLARALGWSSEGGLRPPIHSNVAVSEGEGGLAYSEGGLRPHFETRNQVINKQLSDVLLDSNYATSVDSSLRLQTGSFNGNGRCGPPTSGPSNEHDSPVSTSGEPETLVYSQWPTSEREAWKSCLRAASSSLRSVLEAGHACYPWLCGSLLIVSFSFPKPFRVALEQHDEIDRLISRHMPGVERWVIRLGEQLGPQRSRTALSRHVVTTTVREAGTRFALRVA